MTSIISMLGNNVDLATIIIISIFGALFVLFTLRARAGGRLALRPIRAYERLRELCSQATESASTIHVTLGGGEPEGASMGAAQASLALLRYVGRNVAHTGTPVLATTAHASLLPAAQGMLRAAERADGLRHPHTGSVISHAGQEPLALAVGADATLSQTTPLANVMVGDIGAEGLLLCEGHRETVHLGGSDDPASAALLYVASDETLMGEDVFAGGAYLDRPSHTGSLVAQDALRLVLMITILVGVLATSLGLWG